MDFWQTLVIALLGGTIGGTVGIFLNNYLQARYSKTQKRQVLYGKLRALQESVPNSALYSIVTRLYFEYYNRWKDLSTGKGSDVAFDLLKSWQHHNKEFEIARSDKYAELFETLGLICVLFKKDDAIVEHAKKCFDFPVLIVDFPSHIKTLDDLNVWRRKTEEEIRQLIQERIYKPIEELVSLIHTRTVKKELVTKKSDLSSTNTK